jgi:DNA-binding XRE family transcriptional regulator
VLGKHERFARNPHNSFVWSTTGRGRQLSGRSGNVRADDGKVAVIEFPNIGTAVTAGRFSSTSMGIGAKSFNKVHGLYVTVVLYPVNSVHAYFWGVKADKLYTELCERIIRLLREERKRQGLSKYAVEQRAGISQQMVGYVERGLRKPSLETILRMADGLGVDLSDIIKQARKASPKSK